MLHNTNDEASYGAWLRERLGAFIDAGLIETLPSRWQLRQAELEMTPWVVSADVTAEENYDGALLGHPWIRQPLILAHVGLDHFRTGSGLGAQHRSVCRHLELTYPRGRPVFDLQVIHSHPDGLQRFRASVEELMANRSLRARRQNAVAALIFADREAYYANFLGEDGWIARAERFDYPGPDAEGSECPEEFFSLVGLVNYAARAFDPTLLPWHRRAGHAAHLLGRRFREGRRMGWFGS